MRKMNRIIIFSSARSGGNLLDGMFDQYNGVRSFGELFSRRTHNKRSRFLNDVVGTYTMSNQEVVKVLEDKYSKDYDTWTIRYHGAHYRYSFNKTIYDDVKDFNKVLLYRENFLNKAFSLSVTSYMGKWHYRKNEQTPDYNNFRIYFNNDLLSELFKSTKEYYNNILDRYEDIIIVKYEDLIHWNDLDLIFNEFNIHSTKEHDELKLQRISKVDNSYTNFINLDELQSYKLIFDEERKQFI